MVKEDLIGEQLKYLVAEELLKIIYASLVCITFLGSFKKLNMESLVELLDQKIGCMLPVLKKKTSKKY